jgi:hypothetical protein
VMTGILLLLKSQRGFGDHSLIAWKMPYVSVGLTASSFAMWVSVAQDATWKVLRKIPSRIFIAMFG